MKRSTIIQWCAVVTIFFVGRDTMAFPSVASLKEAASKVSEKLSTPALQKVADSIKELIKKAQTAVNNINDESVLKAIRPLLKKAYDWLSRNPNFDSMSGVFGEKTKMSDAINTLLELIDKETQGSATSSANKAARKVTGTTTGWLSEFKNMFK